MIVVSPRLSHYALLFINHGLCIYVVNILSIKGKPPRSGTYCETGSSLPLLDRHHRLAIAQSHPIRVGMVLILLLLLKVLTQPLSLRHRAVFVLEEDLLQLHNLISHLVHLCRQSVVLAAEYLNLCLQVCKPLLLALSALQSGNTAKCQSRRVQSTVWFGTYRFRSRKFFRFSSSVIFLPSAWY